MTVAMSNTVDVLSIGSGPVHLLALHGIQGTNATWTPVARALAERATTTAPNLRGRGRAVRGAGPADHTLEAFAIDVADVAQRVDDGSPFYLMGWSMGVSVALSYMTIPGAPRPAGLILLSGSPCLRETAWFQGDGDGLMRNIASREKRLGLHDAADHDAVAWTWQAIRDTDQRAELGGITVPTLVIHGDADEDSPWAHAVRLVDGLPQARLVTIEGGRHALPTLNTEAVADHIRAFIA